MLFSPVRTPQSQPLSPRAAYNALSSISCIVLDARAAPSTLIPGSVATGSLDGEGGVAGAASAALHSLMEEMPPDDARTAIVIHDADACFVQGAPVANFLLSNGGCRRAFTVDGAALASSKAWLFGMPAIEQAFPSEIEPGLFLGSAACAEDAKALALLGVTDVVSIVCRNLKLPHIAPERHLLLDAEDADDQDLSDVFVQALPRIADALAGGRAVLVHCERGASRSVSVVIAHMMSVTRGLTVDAALAHVTRARPCAQPNIGFIGQLRQLQARLAAEAGGS